MSFSNSSGENAELAENIVSSVRREGEGTANDHHKRSSRVKLACAPCRASKLKCDRCLPVCEQCYKRSRESLCKYTEKGLRYLSTSQRKDALKEKMERLETFVSRLQGTLPTPDSLPVESAGEGLGDESASQDMTAQMGKLRLYTSGSTQWVGPSHWESIIDDIADVKAYFELEKNLDAPQSEWDNEWNVQEVDVLLGTPRILSIPALLNLLPPKADMDRFVAAWFNIMEPARVIMHAPTFQQQYQNFWLNPREVQPAWLALLLVSSGLGAEISSQASNDTSTRARAELLGRLTAHALVRADATKPQPHLIEALILYAATLLFKHHDATSRTWQLCGLTVRLCYQAGYHRDPSRNPKFSAFDCEMRRRIWMVASELEISVSCCVGRVSSVNSRLCDAAPPANLLDTDFSPAHSSPPRAKEECTPVQIEICFSRLVSILGDITASSHSVIPPSEAEIHSMSERLEKAKDELPQKLRMVPLDQCLIDPPTEVIYRIRLELVYQRALCVLYHRFLGHEKSEREHQSCIFAAEAVVKQSISMLEAAQPGGQLAVFRIMLIRHIHDFNLAAMILCSELQRGAYSGGIASLQNTVSPNVQSMLLQACHLWNASKLPSPKAQVALNAIVAFLKSQDLQLIRSEDRRTDTDALAEELIPGDGDAAVLSAASVGLYDSAALFETAAEGFPGGYFEGHDLAFSSLF
ncbi:hypothetical protein EV356DRAFT_498937 [Viridothelium virens]|uniref:Zn(2)-C6 fungal-type domain-containing protein n=1 Tax=Viridothelium virens TaxID=1048519 RepID=A0A6A6HEZ2_VIRVR|nr:hypothetical protein EV356DRAFT_498937 [Viridothelium virens]